LYRPGIDKVLYTHRGFVRWMVEATALASLTTFLPVFCVRTMWEPEPSVQTIAFTAMFLVVICTNLRLALEVHSWNLLQHVGIWGSLIAIELSSLCFSYVSYEDDWPRAYDWSGFYALVPAIYPEPSYWLAIGLTVVLVCLPRLFGKSLDVFNASYLLKVFAKPLQLCGSCLRRGKASTAGAGMEASMGETSARQRRLERKSRLIGSTTADAELGGQQMAALGTPQVAGVRAAPYSLASAHADSSRVSSSRTSVFSNNDMSSTHVCSSSSRFPVELSSAT
jgi:hypothetical protein